MLEVKIRQIRTEMQRFKIRQNPKTTIILAVYVPPSASLVKLASEGLKRSIEILNNYLRLHSTAGGGLNMCQRGLLHESQLVGMW